MAEPKRNSQKYQSASSENKSAGLNHSSTTDIDANNTAKVVINPETAKGDLAKLSEAYRGIRKTRGFISDLVVALGYKGDVRESYYFELTDNQGRVTTIRISNHNVDGDNANEGEREISIIIKSRRDKNTFNKGKTDVTEYVYFKELIRNSNEDILSTIATDVSRMLDTGEYIDSSGIAVVNPTESAEVERRNRTAEIVDEGPFSDEERE